MKRTPNSESGYALLLIFAMAAIVAITLYTEVPRVAFEAQRDKEQLLVDRGGEYQRAVTLFVRKFQRFPASMEELENTNSQRFLRRRFVDPMTGKKEWRLIHAGPGGTLTDSVDSKKTDQKDQSAPQNFINDIGLTSSSFNQGASGDSVNLATRRRPGDAGGGAGGGGGGDESGNNTQVSNSGIPGYSGPVKVLPDGRIVPANASDTDTPGAAGASGRISRMPGMMPGGLPPGVPGATPGQMNPGLGPMMPSGVAVQQGPPPAAASLINDMLRNPRGGGPGGPSQLQPGPPGQQGPFGQPGPQGQQGQSGQIQVGAGFGQAPAQQQQNVIGAGIAGVASKKEAEGIKTINDHTKYNEWEFVYDITKDPTRQQGAAGAQGGSGQQGRGGANNPQGTNPMNPGGMMPGGMNPGGMNPGQGRGLGR